MLAAELLAALGLLILPATSPTPAPMPLVVGDGRTVELINLGGARSEGLLARVATQLGGAVDAVEAFWGTDWSHHIVVVATGTDAQFAEAAHAPVPAGTAAVAVADSVDTAHRRAVGQRIVLAPGAAAISTQALRIVLAHELFHYATRGDTARDAPRWLTEGVADFVARAATPVPASALPLTLPTDADLDAAEPQRSLAYDRAWWFARFVADSHGTAGLRALYLASCGVGHTDSATAVRAVLGIDLPALLARWQRWAIG